MNHFIGVIRKIDVALAKMETVLVVVVVSMMLLLTTVHVILKLLGMGIIQLEEMARYLVIWVGFLGGAVAAYQARHINIDILTRFVRGVPKRVSVCIVWTIGVVVTIVLARTAVSYVTDLYRSQDIAVSFGLAGGGFSVPEWTMGMVMPFGLVLIAWHMAAGALYAAFGVAGPGHEQSKQVAVESEPDEDEAGGEA